MTQMLALKYRPATWEDVSGQKSVSVILRQMVLKGAVPTALLFDGVRGTGKTTTARILAAALNCEEPPGPCGTCASCKAVADGTSMDVLEIDAASNGLVEDIRQLRDQIMYAVGGRKRVVLLDEAHSMSTAAFNALLKTLEEPPPDTVFVLLTTEPTKIIDTVLSRCMSFTFRKISVSDIESRLRYISEQEGREAEPGLLSIVAERANGGMRDAVMMFDQVTRVGITTAAQFAEHMGDSDYAPTLIRSMLSGNYADVFAGLDSQLSRNGDSSVIAGDLILVLRDVLVLKSGGVVSKQGIELASRESLATHMENERVIAGLKVLWDFKTKIRVSDGRSSLELAVAMLTESLGTKTQKAVVAPSKKLSLADMASLK